MLRMTKSEMSWDLSPLVNGASADEVKKLLDDLVEETKAFATKNEDNIPSMKPDEIKKLLMGLESLIVRVHDTVNYGSLRYAAETTDKESAQLNDWSRKTRSVFTQALTPIDLRLGDLMVNKPEYFDDSAVTDYKHFLERLRDEAPYRLSELEEKLII